MKKKIKLICLSVYFVIGITCSIFQFTTFKNTISIYNIVEQIQNYEYFKYGKKIIALKNIEKGSQEEMHYEYLKVLCGASSFIDEVIEKDNHSLSLLFTKIFGYTLPFVILIILTGKIKISNVKVAILTITIIYLITSIYVHFKSEEELNFLKKHFSKLEMIKVDELMQQFRKNIQN